MDGWTDPKQQSIWAFMIITPSRKEYLYSLQNFSSDHHTAEFLIKQINKIIIKIGPNKISAIVSDNAANIVAARIEISSKYPTIMNLKCIVHCFNLISQDIIKIPFAKRLLRCYSIVVSFFKVSHIAGSLLRDAIEEKKIQGGTLKTYVKTRWSTTYDCVNSVLRCKEAFNYVSYLFLLFIKYYYFRWWY